MKVLGKSAGSCYLQQKIKDEWALSSGCEITDLDHDFFIVLFFYRADYYHVVEIMDHEWFLVISLLWLSGGQIYDMVKSLLRRRWSGYAFPTCLWNFTMKVYSCELGIILDRQSRLI